MMLAVQNDSSYCCIQAPYEPIAIDTRPWVPLRKGVMTLALRLQLRLRDITGLTRSLIAFNYKKWPLLLAQG